ncbi:hypothetical protein TNCV_4496061 [Trichonephila clavipes]|nr:hypothetical protein TNCV_4496061 [Trichonephila clavipes]
MVCRPGLYLDLFGFLRGRGPSGASSVLITSRNFWIHGDFLVLLDNLGLATTGKLNTGVTPCDVLRVFSLTSPLGSLGQNQWQLFSNQIQETRSEDMQI